MDRDIGKRLTASFIIILWIALMIITVCNFMLWTQAEAEEEWYDFEGTWIYNDDLKDGGKMLIILELGPENKRKASLVWTVLDKNGKIIQSSTQSGTWYHLSANYGNAYLNDKNGEPEILIKIDATDYYGYCIFEYNSVYGTTYEMAFKHIPTVTEFVDNLNSNY